MKLVLWPDGIWSKRSIMHAVLLPVCLYLGTYMVLRSTNIMVRVAGRGSGSPNEILVRPSEWQTIESQLINETDGSLRKANTLKAFLSEAANVSFWPLRKLEQAVRNVGKD